MSDTTPSEATSSGWQIVALGESITADIGPVWLDPLEDGSYILRFTKPERPPIDCESIIRRMKGMLPIMPAELQNISAKTQPSSTSQPASLPASLDH